MEGKVRVRAYNLYRISISIACVPVLGRKEKYREWARLGEKRRKASSPFSLLPLHVLHIIIFSIY